MEMHPVVTEMLQATQVAPEIVREFATISLKFFHNEEIAIQANKTLTRKQREALLRQAQKTLRSRLEGLFRWFDRGMPRRED